MNTSTFSEFRLRVNIASDIENVYNAWATRRGLETWFLRKALFKGPEGDEKDKNTLLQTGDSYEWYWHGYPDEVVEKGKVILANGEDTFRFTFSLGCPVNISIYKESGEVIVELVESGLPVDETNVLKHYVGDSRGWIFYLINLKSVLEGGLDLRNKKEHLKDVITA